jgi:outer membrane protein assembly factor BamE
MTAFPRAALALFLLLAALLGSGGCVYRPNIQQGNLLKTEDVDQVTAGMTRSQVRYVLGTPMVADPFNPQRWDYVYTLQRGRSSKVDRAHFVVWFDGDKVSRVEKLHMSSMRTPDGTKQPTAAAAEAAREPPPPPSIKQPQPDAPKPGGNN